MINYDITTKDSCISTISEMTNIDIQECYKFVNNVEVCVTDLEWQLQMFLAEYTGSMTLSIDIADIRYICAHITTSANKCANIQKHGLLDLQQSYSNEDSEIRIFLDENRIFIDLENKKLLYKEKEYVIDNIGGADKLGNIANKFFFDFSVCGFKVIGDPERYSCIHQCPEIIENIGEACKINLKQEWMKDHIPYVVKYSIRNDELLNGKFSEDVFELLLDAYSTALIHYNSYERAITNNGVHILPSDIISIEPLEI